MGCNPASFCPPGQNTPHLGSHLVFLPWGTNNRAALWPWGLGLATLAAKPESLPVSTLNWNSRSLNSHGNFKWNSDSTEWVKSSKTSPQRRWLTSSFLFPFFMLISNMKRLLLALWTSRTDCTWNQQRTFAIEEVTFSKETCYCWYFRDCIDLDLWTWPV